MSDLDNEIRKRVTLGAEAERFLNTNLGRFLVQRAEEVIESAVDELKTVDPENPKTIRALQQKITVAESVQYWLAGAINDGYEAERQYLEAQSPD